MISRMGSVYCCSALSNNRCLPNSLIMRFKAFRFKERYYPLTDTFQSKCLVGKINRNGTAAYDKTWIPSVSATIRMLINYWMVTISALSPTQWQSPYPLPIDLFECIIDRYLIDCYNGVNVKVLPIEWRPICPNKMWAM